MEEILAPWVYIHNMYKLITQKFCVSHLKSLEESAQIFENHFILKKIQESRIGNCGSRGLSTLFLAMLYIQKQKFLIEALSISKQF